MEQHSKEATMAIGIWGILSVIFGVLVLAWPQITLKAFLIVLGIYLIVSGLGLSVGSMVGRAGYWIGGILMGGLSVVAGLYVFAHPRIGALAILTVIAIWSIAVGMLQILVGFEAKNNDWWMIISGFIQLLFGFYIFANPEGGAIALIWLIGVVAIINGIALAVAGFSHKSLSNAR